MGKRKKARGGRERLAQMPRSGGVLQSPYSQLPGVTLSSWRDERLPELLWAAILTASLERDEYLKLFREISERCDGLESDAWQGLGHTNLAKVTDSDFDRLIQPIVDRNLLPSLHALCLFEGLPDSHHWARHINGWRDRSDHDYEVVAEAISLTSWHQSEAATDIRWLRVLSMVLGGKMHFADTMRRQAEEILGFPNVGDMRSVRPSIRAAEQSFGSVSIANDQPLPMDWVNSFWKQCKRETQCLRAEPKRPTKVQLDGLFENVVDVYRKLEEHFHNQESYDAVDSRLDATFGIAIYSMNMLLNIIAGNSYRRVEGRLMLRSLCECYVTLAYLLHINAKKTWQQYRSYGQGQAKLAYLKSIDIESNNKAKFFSESDLEELANEDKWEEFVDIDLGSWSNKSLRSMSEDAGVKDVYDKFFPWPSGYVHGHWSAVRDTVFDLCLNPLHRLHRIPAIPRANMNDCSEDATKLANLTLDLLNKAYPSFKPRVKFPTQA